MILFILAFAHMALAETPQSFFARCVDANTTVDVYTSPNGPSGLVRRGEKVLPTLIDVDIVNKDGDFTVHIKPGWGVSSMSSSKCSKFIANDSHLDFDACLYFLDEGADLDKQKIEDLIKSHDAIPFKAHLHCDLHSTTPCKRLIVLQGEVEVEPVQCSVGGM